MALDVDKELKIYWYCGIITLLIFGLWYFISPESLLTVFNWPFWDPNFVRTGGAIYIAWAIVTLKIYLKDIDQWEKIENWLIFAIMVQILTIIVDIISLILYNIPLGAFLTSVLINLFFIILGIHILMQKRKQNKS